MTEASGTLYCWGSSSCGQLGLPHNVASSQTTIDDVVPVPQQHTVSDIKQVAAGLEHTLFLTTDGQVLVSGNGEVGQLGILLPFNNKQVYHPVTVVGLKNHQITQVAAGEQHSVAVTSFGEVYCWGDNTFGQTGAPEGKELMGAVQYPTLVKALSNSLVVQVACGTHHTLALAADGEVYSWGLNKNGQLGLPQIGSTEPVRRPLRISALHGLPIQQVSCGGQVSACLSRSGIVVTWGSDRHNQLARNVRLINTLPNRKLPPKQWCAFPASVPHLVKYPVPIVHVAASCSHVAAVDAQGKLWLWGSGSSPRSLLDLVGSHVTQVDMGRNHMLALVQGQQVYSMGDSSCGQLGVQSVSGVTTSPTLVQTTWQHPLPLATIDACVQASPDTADDSSAMEIDPAPAEKVFVKQVFCGGDCSFLVTCSSSSDSIDRTQLNRPPASVPQPSATHPLLAEAHAKQLSSMPVALPLPVAAAIAPTTVVSSCAEPSVCPLPVYQLQLQHLEMFARLGETDHIQEDIFNYVETAIGSVACWNQSFMDLRNDSGQRTLVKVHFIDLPAARAYMAACGNISRDTVKDVVFHGLQKVVTELPVELVTQECARVYILVCLAPHLADPAHYATLHIPYANKLMARSSAQIQAVVALWLQNELELDVLRLIVNNFTTAIGYALKKSNQQMKYMPDQYVNMFELVKLLHLVNQRLGQPLPAAAFHVPEIYDSVVISADYDRYFNQKTSRSDEKRCFCEYAFMLDGRSKTVLLRMDAALQMKTAMSMVHPTNMSMIPINFWDMLGIQLCCQVSVRRSHIVQDTLTSLNKMSVPELKLPLKVAFIGEEAQDEGGVRKEFFMLLMREMLSPDYGMFQEFPDTRKIWFTENSFETSEMYAVIGILCGLAIYNSVIINLPFPRVLYKKLLDEPVSIEDLAELDPVMAKSLNQLLEFDANSLEETMALNFILDRRLFGETYTKELKPGGADIPVTGSNREEYVRLVVEYVLNKSIHESYSAFSNGFQRVCSNRIIQLFQSNELMELVIGREDYDWQAFKRKTTYKGEYHEKHPTIELFWRVFPTLTAEEKKRFLLFLTGCDRVPILGMESIPMTIYSVANTLLLPVAHTCVNQLDLPKYEKEEDLRCKLLLAIEHCEGFGLV